MLLQEKISMSPKLSFLLYSKLFVVLFIFICYFTSCNATEQPNDFTHFTDIFPLENAK